MTTLRALVLSSSLKNHVSAEVFQALTAAAHAAHLARLLHDQQYPAIGATE
jgi:hypothetical protein